MKVVHLIYSKTSNIQVSYVPEREKSNIQVSWLVVAFAHLGVVGDGLHFHMFCHSKHLKMFSIKYFTDKIFYM